LVRSLGAAALTVHEFLFTVSSVVFGAVALHLTGCRSKLFVGNEVLAWLLDCREPPTIIRLVESKWAGVTAMWKAVVLLAALLPFTADGDNSFAAISVQTAMQAQLKAFPRNWHLLDALSSCTTVDTSAVGTVYFAQDYTGGGGIGNLLLKINAGLTFAITNGFEYLIPPMLPFGHNESEMYVPIAWVERPMCAWCVLML